VKDAGEKKKVLKKLEKNGEDHERLSFVRNNVLR